RPVYNADQPITALKGTGIRTLGPAERQHHRSSYSLLIMKSLSAPDSAPQISPLRPASCRTLASRSRNGLAFLGLGIEAQDRVRSPVADPHGIGVVHINGVGLRPVAWQMPAPPTVGLAVVAEKISAVPAGDPECAAAVAPDAPCALARHRRF